jgi:hypothetical protein
VRAARRSEAFLTLAEALLSTAGFPEAALVHHTGQARVESRHLLALERGDTMPLRHSQLCSDQLCKLPTRAEGRSFSSRCSGGGAHQSA